MGKALAKAAACRNGYEAGSGDGKCRGEGKRCAEENKDTSTVTSQHSEAATKGKANGKTGAGTAS